MKRREFIKTSCTFCTAVAASGVMGSLLDGCVAPEMIFTAEISDREIKVPEEKISGKKYLVVRSKALEYDLLVVKKSDASFHTVAMQCTHRQQPLVVTSAGLFCNEHGSRFNFDGKVTRDPATRPLIKFKTELKDGNIVIYLS